MECTSPEHPVRHLKVVTGIWIGVAALLIPAASWAETKPAVTVITPPTEVHACVKPARSLSPLRHAGALGERFSKVALRLSSIGTRVDATSTPAPPEESAVAAVSADLKLTGEPSVDALLCRYLGQ